MSHEDAGVYISLLFLLFVIGISGWAGRRYINQLKKEAECLRKLAHDYITAYEKLAFGE